MIAPTHPLRWLLGRDSALSPDLLAVDHGNINAHHSVLSFSEARLQPLFVEAGTHIVALLLCAGDAVHEKRKEWRVRHAPGPSPVNHV
jgi:hypothetical protein